MGRTGAGMAIGRTITRAGFPRSMFAVAVSVGMTRTTLGAVRTAVAVARAVFAMRSVATRSARVIRARATAFAAGAFAERTLTLRTRVRRAVVVALHRAAFATSLATTFAATFVGAGILRTIAICAMRIAAVRPTAFACQSTFSSCQRMKSAALAACFRRCCTVVMTCTLRTPAAAVTAIRTTV